MSAPASLRALMSRAAAGGLLLLLIAGVGLFAIEPLWSAWRAADASIADSRALLAGFARAAAERPALEARLHALGGQTDQPQPGLLEAANAPLAAAQLQSAAKAIIGAAGGQVRSVQDLPAARAGSFQRVAIRLDVGVTTDGLRTALYRIESAQPYMFVDNLAIRAPEAQQRGAIPAAAGGGDALSVRLEVFGYIRAAP